MIDPEGLEEDEEIISSSSINITETYTTKFLKISIWAQITQKNHEELTPVSFGTIHAVKSDSNNSSTINTNKDLQTAEELDKKRKRPWKNTTKVYTPIERDADGQIKLPIQLGALTIFSLGTVITDKKKFHHKRYIWPVGFKSSRSYASLKDFNQRCDYINEIVDGGNEPKFIVTCKDDPDNPIISATASGAWTEIVKRINDQKREMTGKRMFTTVSGPEMFGYG